MGLIKTFLEWCSGLMTLSDGTKERGTSNVTLGTILLVTVLLDSMLFGYCVEMVFGSNLLLFISITLLWFILNLSIYRYLNSYVGSTIIKKQKLSVFSLFPISILVVITSIVVSKPLELTIFSENIHSHLQVLNANQIIDYQEKLKNAYRLPELQKERETAIDNLNKLDETLIAEVKESKASSGLPGYGPRANSIRHSIERQKLELAKLDTLVVNNQNKIDKDVEHFKFVQSRTGYYSFTNQITALNDLKAKNSNIMYISFMLTLLIFILNFLPLLVLFLTNSNFKLAFIRDFTDVDKDVAQSPIINIKDSKNITISASKNSDEEKYKSFETYFNSMIVIFDREMERSNQKASILLNRGVWTSILGIVYYLVSIVSFQSLFSAKGFQSFHIYGIVSSTVLFIFIQFVGAWFLKQYRYFVDTSTYYFKLKTTIERYLLSYLALKENSTNKDETLPKLLEFLMQDIKFPETYLIKQADVNLTKETIETTFAALNETLKSLKDMKK